MKILESFLFYSSYSFGGECRARFLVSMAESSSKKQKVSKKGLKKKDEKKEDNGDKQTIAEGSFVRVKHLAPKSKKQNGARSVWVSRRSNQAHLVRRCSALLDSPGDAVTIHGLGAAVEAAANLSLELRRRWNEQLVVDVQTTTVELTDELRAMGDNVDSKIETRLNSSIIITLRRKNKNEK